MSDHNWYITNPIRQRVLLLTIFLLTTLEFLQSGMIAFAASPIMGETGTSPEEYSFITAAYACIAIVMISKQRWIVERTGWRIYIWCSIAVFVTGAAICAESETYHSLMTGRIIMGIGGASFMTGARVLVNLIPPSPKRFTGIKMFATGLAMGTASAPLIAAMAVSEDTWAGIFYVLIAIAVLAFICASFCLPMQSPPEKLKSQSHPVLLMLLAVGSFTLLWALQRSNYNFFSDSLILIVIALTGLSAIYYFFHGVHRQKNSPLLEVRTLFSNKRYIAGVALFSFCYLVLGVNNYIIPQILQSGMGFSWSTVGHWHALGLTTALIAWLVMSKVMPKRPSSKKFFLTGFMALAVYGFLMMKLTPSGNIITDVLPALLFNGAFIMLVMATTAVQTFREVQHNETVFSHAQQVKNMAAQFFMSLGITLATVGMQWRTTIHYAVLNTRVTSADPRHHSVIDQVSALYERHFAAAKSHSMAVSWVAQMVKQQSTLLAALDFYNVIFLFGIAMSLVMSFQKLMK